MSKVFTDFTISLDGFVAGPNHEVGPLFGWYFSGDTPVPTPDGSHVFRLQPESAAVFREMIDRSGAIVTGRRDFDVSKAWGGKSPMPAPIFIVTHTPPAAWTGPDSPFVFVTTGVADALARARAAAGGKDIAVSGTTIVQQCLQAGLLDEINLHLVPLLLGAGIRLFDHLGAQPRALAVERVVATPDVTHLRYRVIK
jgi:dihydrofolate reductase